MEHEFLVLSLAVFGAAALQSATGIGFGVIAGPVLLVALNDGSAIQISIILNLLIALLLAPSLRHKVERRLLVPILIGLAVGTPLGLSIYLAMDIGLLKTFAGMVVLFTLFFVFRGSRPTSPAVAPAAAPAAKRIEQITLGVVAGVMGGSLAMPGPVPAAWMSARGYRKESIRATILFMFVFAYTAALALQFALAGISAASLRLSFFLTPSTIAGILLGGFLSTRISERVFHRLLIIILMSTAIILFSTLA